MVVEHFDQQRLFDVYLTALTKAWESYLRIIDLAMALAGATALVFVNSIRVSDWQTLPNKRLIIYVFLTSGSALLCGALWRLASQHFMEYETIGSEKLAGPYFEATGVKPITTAHAKKRIRPFYRCCFRILPIPTGALILASWAFIFVVLFGK
jgi:hypothetical protein